MSDESVALEEWHATLEAAERLGMRTVLAAHEAAQARLAELTQDAPKYAEAKANASECYQLVLAWQFMIAGAGGPGLGRPCTTSGPR